MKYFKKILSLVIVVIILLGTVVPSLQPSFAATSNVFTPAFTYNSETGKWDISWTPITGSTSYTVIYHEPDDNGDVKVITETGDTADTINEQNVLSLTLLPDHIYDFEFSFENGGSKVSFKNKYDELVESETTFFIADITFRGTSFDDQGGLLDEGYETNSDDQGEPVTRIISGHKPRITFRWKVPTIYDSKIDEFIYITQKNEDVLDKLEVDGANNISFSYFHIRMNEITDRERSINYRTTYSDSDIILRETGRKVEGFDDSEVGVVEAEDGFVSFTLDQTNGIKSGTEYANIDIRLFFWDEGREREVISSKLVYGYVGGSGFSIVNYDIVFRNIGFIDSIFTPMHFEVSKVDVDKMEVKIKKVKNSNYPQLYYQVQEAASFSEFLGDDLRLSGGIKMPDSSIPDHIGWGSIIIEVPLNENGEHPLYYYRVVVTDGDSSTPLCSLAIDLSILDTDTGKPTVPREIDVQPIYKGKQEIKINEQDVKIPLTDIRIYFEKPLFWDNTNPEKGDLTFHVLLNTYLSDNVRESETKAIGEPEVTVRLPVTESRVATFGRGNIKEDEKTGMLYFELDGKKLFHDFHLGQPLDFENDKDYPTFLIPNTKYYLRMFSTWAEDNENIKWVDGDMEELSEIISYVSPVVSFTTYPTQDIPIPIPSFSLDISPKDEIDSETGRPIFNGITVDFAKILDNEDWRNYTEVLEGRKIKYEIFISDSNEKNSFKLVDEVVTTYPDENPNAGLSALITKFPINDGEALKPNTTYYLKMQATLFVDGEDDFIIGDETPVKSITTPKTDSGSMEDLERLPRTPIEFSIATDSNGSLELTDARVTLLWLHAEQDVTYEMVCTTKKLDANASLDDYIRDDYHIGYDNNPGFLTVYKDYKTNSSDTELNIDVLNTKLYDSGFTYNEDGNRIARFPVNLPFLKPNQLYYFSVRAVRDRDTNQSTYSKWVSIPVTTKMVEAPKFLEAVNDVQLGFNIAPSGGIRQEDIKIMLKKADQPDSSYVEVSRGKYSVVRDGRRYYFRLYDLEPDTWYDIQPFYNDGNEVIWYDSDDGDWSRRYKESIQMKTRNTLNEIEIRFEGEGVYDYFIEIRTDYSEDYVQLIYDRDQEDSDYGYVLDGDRMIEFYREKTQVYVDDSQSDKYMYYAKIYQARQKRSNGSYVREKLLSNTRYYIKIWARNKADSSHIGPVTVRTDFNQKDYDDDYKRDEISDMFESKADKLTKKLYFTVDELDRTSNRVFLKGAMISNFMRIADHSGITIDISKEKPDAMMDIIIVPMEILETLQTTTSRLTIRLSGCELTLTKDTVNLDELKKSVPVTGVKETMLEIAVHRKKEGSVRPSLGYAYRSDVYDIEFTSLSMSRSYAQINEIIYDILKESGKSGPFKYGILDIELRKLLERESVLTYQSYTDLENVIELAVDKVEEQLSSYIQDILDGGRGFSASVIRKNKLTELKDGIRLKILQTGSSGLVEPYVLSQSNGSWSKTSGVKGWAFPYILFTAKVPGEYTILNAPRIILPETDGFTDIELQRFSQEYDLRRIFGSTLYPGDYISADNAVNLFVAITETQPEVAGMSASAKIRYFSFDEFISPSLLNQVLNKGQANSLIVEIYAFKTGVSSAMMRPSTFMHITNVDKIPDAIYNRLVIALDLGLTELEADYTYKHESKATVEETLHSIITVLELLGEW